MTLFILSALSLSISFALTALAVFIGKKSLKDREKLSPFECGFDPFNKARMPFSLRFFLVTIIFLIFDVEVAILLPLALISMSVTTHHCLSLTMLIMLTLLAGLCHEWNQGALSWVS